MSARPYQRRPLSAYLQERARQLAADAPPFTPDQRARLAVLLRPEPLATPAMRRDAA